MALYAARQIVGPYGVSVDKDSPIPSAWAVDDPFVVECIEHGFIVSLDEPPISPTPVGEPTVVNVGGEGKRQPHAQGGAQ